MQTEALVQLAVAALEDLKGQDITTIDVQGKTSVTDYMIIASGRSALQVKSLSDEVEEKLAEMGEEPIRKEGQQEGRWVVLDYGNVLVHIFHPEEREFYRLDKLWEHDQNRIALGFDENDED